MKADGRFDIVSGSTDYGYVIMQMCPNKPPFDNPAVRKAMQLAFDRDAIIQLAYQGQALPAYGLWPTNNVNFNPATQEDQHLRPEEGEADPRQGGREGRHVRDALRRPRRTTGR